MCSLSPRPCERHATKPRLPPNPVHSISPPAVSAATFARRALHTPACATSQTVAIVHHRSHTASPTPLRHPLRGIRAARAVPAAQVRSLSTLPYDHTKERRTCAHAKWRLVSDSTTIFPEISSSRAFGNRRDGKQDHVCSNIGFPPLRSGNTRCALRRLRRPTTVPRTALPAPVTAV